MTEISKMTENRQKTKDKLLCEKEIIGEKKMVYNLRTYGSG